MEDKTDAQDTYIDSLFGEMKRVRDSIFLMITELEALSRSISTMFPETLNYKSRWVFEEKVKATTEMFKALLDMRKEVIKSFKDEIEIRRKIKKEVDGELDLEDMFNIRELASKVVKFQKKVSNIKSTKDEKDENDEKEKIGIQK